MIIYMYISLVDIVYPYILVCHLYVLNYYKDTCLSTNSLFSYIPKNLLGYLVCFLYIYTFND